MITKEELLVIAKEIKACDEAIEFINECEDIDEVINKASRQYWVYLLKHQPQFAEYKLSDSTIV